MNILLLGGTRFFGVHTVNALLERGHTVTIATRGRTPDGFGSRVQRITLDRTDPESMRAALTGKHFDVAVDKLAYCSNEIKSAMETLDCGRYIYMSTTALYEPKHMDTREEDFDPFRSPVIWCDRPDFPYDEVKRQAERALWQKYGEKNWTAVRYPFVVGRDDYTRRLAFYVEHAINGQPMQIDNPDAQMGFIRSDEAGAFMAFLAEQDFSGAVNGCSAGTVSIREVLNYVRQKTGKAAVLSPDGDPAPYNSEPPYSINTEKAAGLGFTFSNVRDWFFDLVDFYIEQA